MKEPEKIYCHRNEFGYIAFSEQPFNYAKEYIRADAFIEKACEWLDKNVAELTGVDSYALTESFKKAMEE